MAPGLNFDVSPATLLIAGVAAFAFYVYTIEEAGGILDDTVIEPASTLYDDWLEPLSPKSIGKNISKLGKWLT